MNVLMFVMCMLMLLALMTYGRLESFRGFAFVQAQFKEFMVNNERNYVNEEAVNHYDKSVASKQEKDEHEETKRNQASSTLSFNLFVDKEERSKHQPELEHLTNVAKNLMEFLYGDQPFFLEMEAKRPDFLNEILAALMRVTDDFGKKDKLKKTKEIATIDLGDLELNDVFTKMLKGSVEEPVISEKKEGEPDVFVKRNPFKPMNGYFSLLDFLTVQKNKLKIRVFLASPQLLMAIYGNADLVQQILNTRKELYRNLVNGAITAEQAKADFQGQFQNQQLGVFPGDMLDFGVSKTNPNH